MGQVILLTLHLQTLSTSSVNSIALAYMYLPNDLTRYFFIVLYTAKVVLFT